MLGTDNQYIIGFSIGDKKDFILEGKLITFSLIEQAGNVLPTFEVNFIVDDEDILKLLNEGNVLSVTYGRNKNDLITTNLRIAKLQVSRRGTNEIQIYINGLLSADEYLRNPIIQITDEKSGVEVINNVVSNHFSTDFNVTSSNDSQNWIQPNITNKRFVSDIWMHIDLPNSFPAIGISSEGRFILKDVKTEVSKTPKWNFVTKTTNSPNEIAIDGDPLLSVESGFINSWLGNGLQKTIFNIEDGTNELVSSEVNTLLALAKNFSRNDNLTARYDGSNIVSDNVHNNYWSAESRNLTGLALFSSTQMLLSFSSVFFPIRILDLVIYKDTKLGETQSSEYTSGRYLISKISRNISNRSFNTTVQLSRESINLARGNFR